MLGTCTLQIARQVLGLPALVREPVTISAAALERVTGTYAFNQALAVGRQPTRRPI